MDGIDAEKLRIKELLTRVADDTVQEVIMATNPTVEGETTAAYISRLLKPLRAEGHPARLRHSGGRRFGIRG